MAGHGPGLPKSWPSGDRWASRRRMVELPGSLERSTLGDVLGALHRDRVTGTLCLYEIQSGRAMRHVITWREGLIHHVETTRPTPGAGTPGSFRAAARWTQDDVHRQELLERLEGLFEIRSARLSFTVMGPRVPRAGVPLEPKEFLHGRRRSRDTGLGGSGRRREPSPPPPAASELETPRARALRTLGLQGNPGADTVRAAFRQLARQWHPDRHPGANEPTRAALCQRFAQISGAYSTLIGHGR